MTADANVLTATFTGPKTWKVSFAHKGRKFTLSKLKQDKESPYYIRIKHGGKWHRKSLEVNQGDAAIDRARVWLDALFAGKWMDVEKLKARKTSSTVAELLAVYREVAHVQPVTLKNNQDAIRWIFKVATGSYEPETIRLTELSASLIARSQKAICDRALALAIQTPDGQREAKDRALRSSRSVIRQARSLFNRRHRMIEAYEARGLTIPKKAIEDFMTGRVEGRDKKPEYFPPSDDVVQAAFKAIEDQKCRPVVYVAFWLAAGAGLRRSEIGRMRWEFIVDRQGKKWISGAIGKDGEKIEVPIQDRAVKALKSFIKPSGKCIEQESLEWARKLNNWMESQGWSTEKKMHELRAYTGSLIYQEDPIAAMMFLRHKSIRQTEDFYVRYAKGSKTVQVL